MKRYFVLASMVLCVFVVQAQSASSVQSLLQGANGGTAAPSDLFGGMTLGNSGSLNVPPQSTDLTFGSLSMVSNGRAQLASTTMTYPVTPGDIYTLSFIQNTNTVSVPLVVQADYTIDLGIFGSQNARGLLFQAFKTQLEKKVAASYPGSSPVVMIQSTGIFTVKVDGEVTKADLAQVWGLEQLSDLFPQIATNFSSLRNVRVRSFDGSERSYDLFLASRTGAMADDPYLRPGDVVTLFKADRTITIEGAVYRPGTYQLLPGEGAADLIGTYCQGLLPTARADLAVLVRKASAEKPQGASLFFDAGAGSPLPPLLDGDKITVPTKDSYLPVVYIEGAIAPLTATSGVTIVSQQNIADMSANAPSGANGPLGQEAQPTYSTMTGSAVAPLLGLRQTSGPSTSSGLVGPQTTIGTGTNQGGGTQAVTPGTSQYSLERFPYKPGDTASRLLRTVAPRLLPTADLQRAFIARKGQADTIPLDIERLLFDFDPSIDVVLQPEDRIVIPSGSLDVFVTGEVTKSTWVNTAALTHLSSVIGPLLTRYSSTRDVEVTSSGGEKRSFDLFKAERYGLIENDPFLKPGDTVTVRSAERIVTIAGEVRRPGRYQLLAGEGLKDLVEVYGDGFTENANPARLTLTRAPSTGESVGSMMPFDYAAAAKVELEDFDTVTVAPITELLPVAWFEGALGVGINGEDPQAAKRIPYTFVPGETLSHATQALRAQFSAVSDLALSYIIRGRDHLPVDLTNFLYNRDFSADVALQAGDIVIVPFRQFFVSVSGAVKLPGRYPYVPDRDWRYYIGLAGGFDKDKNSGDKITIQTVDGRSMARNGRFIEPEDTIVAASNDFFFNLGKISVALSSILSILSVILYISKL